MAQEQKQDDLQSFTGSESSYEDPEEELQKGHLLRLIFRIVYGIIMGSVLFIFLPLIVKVLLEYRNIYSLGEVTAVLFVFLTLPISIYKIWIHTEFYYKPSLQIHVVRILLMIPIYSVSSLIDFRFPEIGYYLNSFREFYEAFVIYSFFKYLSQYLQEVSGDMYLYFESKPDQPQVWPLNKIWPAWKSDQFYGKCYNGVMAYVFWRPISCVIAIILDKFQKYNEDSWSYDNGWCYLAIFNNFIQAYALYCLVMFFHCTKRELAPLQPLYKFMSVKLVVFFSFWQNFVISVVVLCGLISFGDERCKGGCLSKKLQDWLICIEMLGAALLQGTVFPVRDYTNFEIYNNNSSQDSDFSEEEKTCLGALLETLYFKDLFADYKTHASSYQRRMFRMNRRARPYLDKILISEYYKSGPLFFLFRSSKKNKLGATSRRQSKKGGRSIKRSYSGSDLTKALLHQQDQISHNESLKNSLAPQLQYMHGSIAYRVDQRDGDSVVVFKNYLDGVGISVQGGYKGTGEEKKKEVVVSEQELDEWMKQGPSKDYVQLSDAYNSTKLPQGRASSDTQGQHQQLRWRSIIEDAEDQQKQQQVDKQPAQQQQQTNTKQNNDQQIINYQQGYAQSDKADDLLGVQSGIYTQVQLRGDIEALDDFKNQILHSQIPSKIDENANSSKIDQDADRSGETGDGEPQGVSQKNQFTPNVVEQSQVPNRLLQLAWVSRTKQKILGNLQSRKTSPKARKQQVLQQQIQPIQEEQPQDIEQGQQ